MDELYLLNYLPFFTTRSHTASAIKKRFTTPAIKNTSFLEDPESKVRAAINLIDQYLLPISQNTLDSVIIETSSRDPNCQTVLVTLESPSGIKHTLTVQTKDACWEHHLFLSALEICQIYAG